MPRKTTAAVSAEAEKRPFDIDDVFARLRTAVSDLPKATMFDLRDRGFATPFEQLVGSLISARTRDETTTEVCLRLFSRARAPQELAGLGVDELTKLIAPATFPEVKARDLLAIARDVIENHGGRVPDTVEGLMSFRGVGPKIAALTIAVGFGRPAIAVDVHVHRVTNRWGYVASKTPERTAEALALILPKPYWVEINERLVPFGKHVCTGLRPRCSACPLRPYCLQVGVTDAR